MKDDEYLLFMIEHLPVRNAVSEMKFVNVALAVTRCDKNVTKMFTKTLLKMLQKPIKMYEDVLESKVQE